MDIKVRALRPDEFAEFRGIDRLVFGDPPPAASDEPARSLFDLERTRCAFVGGKMVATAAAFTFDFSVPGGELPMGATTCVAVLPTHRRRGALRAMMRAHLDEVRERGESMAALWASEGGIYGRFGFGPASEGQQLELDGSAIGWREPLDTGQQVDLVLDVGDVLDAMRDVHERALARRPGMFRAGVDWWLHHKLLDDPARRGGGSAHRFLVCRDADGVPDGYAIYRQHSERGNFGQGTVQVHEVVPLSAPAHAALWRVLTGIDLYPKVNYWNAPTDDPLPWLLADRFKLRRQAVDGLWLRPLAVDTVLEARRYMADGELVLEVRDDYYPDVGGKFLLTIDEGVATCARTARSADIALDVSTLGSLYLGGQSITPLADARLVRGDAQALHRADRMLAWPVAPWCGEIF